MAKKNIAGKVTFAALLILYFGAALAGNADPLGSGMCKVVDMLTGKWAFGISVVALASVATAFLFGVEMSEMMKKIAGFVTAVAFLVFGGSVLKFIFPAMVGC
ncbi:TrbC/VirB2 family protein [Glaciimonas sp. GG7]